MIQNYLAIAWRNVRRHTGYTLLNLGGLAVGLACCVLIALFIQDELSYDRFHANADRLVRTTVKFDPLGSFVVLPSSSGPKMAERFAEIEAVVRIHPVWDGLPLRQGAAWVQEPEVVYADANLFTVFTFPLLAGDPASALVEPNTVVVTESTARRYFGDANPMGQTLQRNDGTLLRVTGVAADVPTNSHLTFNAVISYATLDLAVGLETAQSYTYFLLSPGTTPAQLQGRFDAVIAQGYEQTTELIGFAVTGVDMQLNVEPLTDIHLYAEQPGNVETTSDVRHLWAFGAVALFILLLACVNYINLATARSARRQREVGVRKALGAAQGQLMGQFLTEAILICFGALLLGVVLVELVLPAFNARVGKSLALNLFADRWLLLALVGLGLGVGLLAGGYPAWFLARFRPVVVLKGRERVGGLGLRRGLVVFQFAVSVALIVGTLVVQQQLAYIQGKALGYDTEQVAAIRLPDAVQPQAEVIKQGLLTLPGVASVSIATGPPMQGWTYVPEIHGQPTPIRSLPADPDYLETMGFHLIAGRGFDPNRSTDTTAVVVSELYVRTVFPGQAIDDVLGGPDHDGRYTIIGVVSDFHTASLRDAIMPSRIEWDSDMRNWAVVRFQAAAQGETVAALAAWWPTVVPDEPLVYHFVDDMLASSYEAERKVGHLFNAFAGLALLIACLGLFGLAAFAAEQRTKEVGIRKVLGASVASLITLLTGEFLKLVVVAFVLGLPLAYFAMDYWLADFAYRIDIGWPTLVGAAVLAIAVAWLTVAYQAFRAATADPVKSLRYE